MFEMLAELNRMREEQIPAVLCVVVESSGSTPRKAGSKMLVYADGGISGTIGGGAIEYQVIQEALRSFGTGIPVLKDFNLLKDLSMECGGRMLVYLEPIGVVPHLYIFGGGHVGKALAALTPGLGFSTTVIDHREDMIAALHIPSVKTICGDYFSLLGQLTFNRNTYIAIVTPKHEFDEKLLMACAGLEWAYLGMIGSKRKVSEIRQKAVNDYGFSDELMSKIDMPIGIPFAAETPAEIAISIAARLIDVKNSLQK